MNGRGHDRAVHPHLAPPCHLQRPRQGCHPVIELRERFGADLVGPADQAVSSGTGSQ
jgi:hypothetical protein